MKNQASGLVQPPIPTRAALLLRTGSACPGRDMPDQCLRKIQVRVTGTSSRMEKAVRLPKLGDKSQGTIKSRDRTQTEVSGCRDTEWRWGRACGGQWGP